jgi:hypothetical protein
MAGDTAPPGLSTPMGVAAGPIVSVAGASVGAGPRLGNGLKFGGSVPAGGVGSGVVPGGGVGAALTTIVPFIRSGWMVQW